MYLLWRYWPPFLHFTYPVLSAEHRSRYEALRHQIGILQRGQCPNPRLRTCDRRVLAFSSQIWREMEIAASRDYSTPSTVRGLASREGLADGNWDLEKPCRAESPGRPAVLKETRDLIRNS
jgi:hypothetical protein